MATREHDQKDEYDETRWVYLTREEEFAIFERAARRYMDMSGEEFLRRWKTGDFEDPDSFEVLHVGIRIPPEFIEE